MKILLAGSAGYIGSHTAVELLEAGHDVIVVDNYSNRCSESIARVEQITGKKVLCYEPKLLFYKDSNYKEISLIMEVAGRLYPVAITKDEFKTSKLYKNFQILAPYAEEHGLELGSGCVIGMGKPEAVLEHGICYVAAEKL